MKKIILALLCLLFAQVSLSQDVIVLKNGSKIEAKIVEISSQTVKYKLFTQPDGPLRSLETYEISEIVYEDGQYDKFDVAPPAGVRTATVRPPRPPKPVKDPFLSRGFFIDATVGYSNYKTRQYNNEPFDPLAYQPYYIYKGRSNFMIGVRIGTKWYLTKKEKWRPGIQVNWMRIGIHMGGKGAENILFGPRTISPLNIGMTNIFKFDENRGLEVNGLFGPTFSIDVMEERLAACLGGNLEVKYRKKGIAYGIDYQFAFDTQNNSYPVQWNVIALTIGRKF